MKNNKKSTILEQKKEKKYIFSLYLFRLF